MKAVIARTELADTLGWVAAAVGKKPPFPELGGIRVTAVKGKGKKRGSIRLEGYDFEVGHTAVIEADVLEPGVAVVPGFLFRDLAGALRGETVAVESDDRALVLRAGRSTYRLNGFDPEAFPNLPVLDVEPAGAVDSDELRLMLGQVAFACDDDHPSARLKGARLDARQGDHKLVALGMVSAAIGAAWCAWDGTDLSARVPSSSLAAAVRGLEGDVTLAADPGTLALTTDTRSVTLRQYADDGEGEVDWMRMIPPTHDVEVVADRAEIADALVRARLALAPPDGDTGAPVSLSIKPKSVTISASGSDSADGTEVVDVTLDGKGIDVSFGADLLMRALASCPDGPVILRGTVPGKPFTVTDKSDTFVLIIMPRRP